MSKRITWRDKVLAATHHPVSGEPSQFGAILDCVLDSDAQQTIEQILAAFVGTFSDLMRNVEGIVHHLHLSEKQEGELNEKIRQWIRR